MSSTKDTNRQAGDNSKRKGSIKSITRRGIIIGGTTLAGAAAVGIVGHDQSQAQQPQKDDSKEKSATGRLKGKVAVITGGARGIGRECAVTFAREGADVVVCDIAKNIDTVVYPLSSAQDLVETERLVKAQGRRCLIMQADVRDSERMRQAIERSISEFGKVDILVANAGILSSAPIATMSDEQWCSNIDVDLTGVFYSMRGDPAHDQP